LLLKKKTERTRDFKTGRLVMAGEEESAMDEDESQ
jgi:hypothetical protein